MSTITGTKQTIYWRQLLNKWIKYQGATQNSYVNNHLAGNRQPKNHIIDWDFGQLD